MSAGTPRLQHEKIFRIYGAQELDANGYPLNWPEISRTVKAAADWKCENCEHPNSKPLGRVLTVHHLNGLKADCRRENLAALCQVCHLRLQQTGAAAPRFPREQRRMFVPEKPTEV